MKNLFFLITSPIRGAMKRLGSPLLQKLAWEAEYKRGDHFHHTQTHGRSSICAHVERYATNGLVLDLGCADAHVAFGLDRDKVSSYVGVDISEVAVQKATVEAEEFADNLPERTQFLAADIFQYEPENPVDVILFKDALYYITAQSKLLPYLNGLKESLTDEGVFIVQMDNLQRHSWIRDLIRQEFAMIDEMETIEDDYMRLVFR